MGINVKNLGAEAEIRHLADRLGVGLTEAIQAGVRAKLAELDAQKQADFDRKMAAIKRIQEEMRPFVKPGTTSSCDEFYDEDGLPI
jgi:hypothetical protein